MSKSIVDQLREAVEFQQKHDQEIDQQLAPIAREIERLVGCPMSGVEKTLRWMAEERKPQLILTFLETSSRVGLSGRELISVNCSEIHLTIGLRVFKGHRIINDIHGGGCLCRVECVQQPPL